MFFIEMSMEDYKSGSSSSIIIMLIGTDNDSTIISFKGHIKSSPCI